jgi:hypothetical protein
VNLKINNKNVECEIDYKLNATDPIINATTDDLLMFTGANDTSLKQLLEGKLNATALDNTVVTTNTLTDPIIVGNLNYKETASDTDGRNLISEISNKANLNAPKFSTSLQLNSTNVLLQPGDFNGMLQAYIEMKAPEQTPPDLSGLISKPAEYNGDLESYIQLKAPEQTPPDLSEYSLTTEIGDALEQKSDKSVVNSALENLNEMTSQNLNMVMPKAQHSNPFFIVEDIGGSQEWISFSDIVTAYAPPPANLSGYVTDDNLNGQLGNYTTTVDINSQLEGYVTSDELGDYTTTADSNSQLEGYADREEVSANLNNFTPSWQLNNRFDNHLTKNEFSTNMNNYMPAWRVNELLVEKDVAIVNLYDRVSDIEIGFSAAFVDPIWNMSDIENREREKRFRVYREAPGFRPGPCFENNLTFEQVVYAYAPPPDLSTDTEKPDDFAENDLASYFESKATSAGYKLVNEWFKMDSQYNPDQSRGDKVHTFADGTYTAVQILDEIQGVITEFMRYVFIKYGFGVVKDESKYNLERFNPDFTVNKMRICHFRLT